MTWLAGLATYLVVASYVYAGMQQMQTTETRRQNDALQQKQVA